MKRDRRRGDPYTCEHMGSYHTHIQHTTRYLSMNNNRVGSSLVPYPSSDSCGGSRGMS